MMRDIKFRAWFDDGEMLKLNISTNPKDIVRLFTQCENAKIMQYTGLKDKNGKEIYEGDIIKKPEEKNHKGKIIKTKPYIIVFDEGGFHAEDGFHLSLAVKDYEVIGNIYENPELLK